MDTVINYDKAAGFLKNPPSLEPRPNFINIRALQKHIVQGLAQLSCPQSAIHGWSGLAMDPAAYLLLESTAFMVPQDPGPTLDFPGGAAVARLVMKMTQATFDRAKNYFLSYKNILRACFRMLDANVSAQFKVSNSLTLTGLNSTMTIIDILSQLQGSYGKPNMMTLHTNDTLFRSSMTQAILLRCSFIDWNNARRYNKLASCRIQTNKLLQTRFAFSRRPTYSPSRNLTHGRRQPPRHTRPSRRSSMKRTAGASPPLNFATPRAKMVTQTIPFTMRLKMARKTPMMIR
jgi:hypothetical protein